MGNELKVLLESIKERAKNFSVLYVEDEKELREQMDTFLRKVFAHMEVAVDGEDGLKKYLQGKHDIVITDIQMPKMNGLELIKKIKETTQEQEIILVSAYTESAYMDEALKMGVTNYIIKPTDFVQILKVLEESIDKISASKKTHD